MQALRERGDRVLSDVEIYRGNITVKDGLDPI